MGTNSGQANSPAHKSRPLRFAAPRCSGSIGTSVGAKIATLNGANYADVSVHSTFCWEMILS